jgi:hypothetical protein
VAHPDLLAARVNRGARVLAVVGTVLVGLPLAAPLVFAAVMAIARGRMLVDFLMPGELVLLVVGGGVALLVAAVMSRTRGRLIALLLAGVAVSFGAMSVLATATGLASGRTAAEGWPLVVVMGSYSLYVAGVIGLFIAGVVLARELFHHTRSAAA